MAPVPKNERKRLEVLWQYDVLDTVPEQVFDDLTELAANICESPIALLTLVDRNASGSNPRSASASLKPRATFPFVAMPFCSANCSSCPMPRK